MASRKSLKQKSPARGLFDGMGFLEVTQLYEEHEADPHVSSIPKERLPVSSLVGGEGGYPTMVGLGLGIEP